MVHEYTRSTPAICNRQSYRQPLGYFGNSNALWKLWSSTVWRHYTRKICWSANGRLDFFPVLAGNCLPREHITTLYMDINNASWYYNLIGVGFGWVRNISRRVLSNSFQKGPEASFHVTYSRSNVINSSSLPDWPFHNFRASKSGDRLFHVLQDFETPKMWKDRSGRSTVNPAGLSEMSHSDWNNCLPVIMPESWKWIHRLPWKINASRRTLSQLAGFKIHRSTFPNYTKCVDLLISRL